MPEQIQCPNGHVSEWPDYCSQCGAAIAAPSAEVAPSPDVATPAVGISDPNRAGADAGSLPGAGAVAAVDSSPASAPGTCPNCHAPTRPTDVFCEACGSDLAAAVSPDAVLGRPSGSGSDVVASTGTAVEVLVDRSYFDAFVEAGALAFPDPAPAPVLLPVTQDELLIGRRSDSRAVFPDVDAQALTEDPAVSHRHALLRRDANGAWSVIDQGSTNGSRLDRSTDLLVPGRTYPLGPDTVLHVGAWTSIRIITSTESP